MYYIYHTKYGYSYFDYRSFDSKQEAVCYIALLIYKKFTTHIILSASSEKYDWTKDNPEKVAAERITKLPVNNYKIFMPELTELIIYDDINNTILFPTTCMYDFHLIFLKGYGYLQYLSNSFKSKKIKTDKHFVFRKTITGLSPKTKYYYKPSFGRKTISRLCSIEDYSPNSRERTHYNVNKYYNYEYKLRHIEKGWKKNKKRKKQWQKHKKPQEIDSRSFLMYLVKMNEEVGQSA